MFVAPSIQENLANTVMESLSCGTPVVAFNIGGMPDMIVHKKNGYLAKPFDTEDLACGIEYCLNKIENRDYIAADIHERFAPKRIAEQYYKIYQNLLK